MLVNAEAIQFPLVFLEGILSFFSPCVIPLLPVYIGYLAGGASHRLEDGTTVYRRSTVMLHTVFFVLGISAVFFLLGFSFTALGQFFGALAILSPLPPQFTPMRMVRLRFRAAPLPAARLRSTSTTRMKANRPSP